MTQFEALHSMSVDELAEWMSDNPSEDSPWIDWWENTYCYNCESITLTREEVEQYFGFHMFGDTTQCAYCELNNDKCRYFSHVPSGKEVAKMWLESEVKA